MHACMYCVCIHACMHVCVCPYILMYHIHGWSVVYLILFAHTYITALCVCVSKYREPL